MDLIWGHISPELVSCPELKNIGLTFWHFRKTSFWFSRHVPYKGLKVRDGVVVAHVIIVSPQSQMDLDFDLGLLWVCFWV